jgi:hypothetical protein
MRDYRVTVAEVRAIRMACFLTLGDLARDHRPDPAGEHEQGSPPRNR